MQTLQTNQTIKQFTPKTKILFLVKSGLLQTPSAKIGELPTTFYLFFLVLSVFLSVFSLCLISKIRKNLPHLLLLWVPLKTPSCVTSLVTSYEIKPALLNLVMRDQFSGAGDDVALHLNNFVELCDMQKYKEVQGDVVKLKLFSFLFEGRS